MLEQVQFVIGLVFVLVVLMIIKKVTSEQDYADNHVVGNSKAVESLELFPLGVYKNGLAVYVNLVAPGAYQVRLAEKKDSFITVTFPKTHIVEYIPSDTWREPYMMLSWDVDVNEDNRVVCKTETTLFGGYNKLDGDLLSVTLFIPVGTKIESYTGGVEEVEPAEGV